MTPAELEGLVIGPVAHRIDRERVRAFVDASGDDAQRWREVVPPGYGAVLLFSVAGTLLNDPRIAPFLATLIHVDQQFIYLGPIPVDAVASVTGTVDRVRERGGAYFVTFVMSASIDGDPLLQSRSTFLMSDQAATSAAADLEEPNVDERSENDRPSASLPADVGTTSYATRSASRRDLVKYAAATADLNPLHWDHASARMAGLEGVVVHGLLMLAWLAQHAGTVGAGTAPIANVKARFRNALRPAQAASSEVTISAISTDATDATLAIRLVSEGKDLVTGSAVVRLEAVTQ